MGGTSNEIKTHQDVYEWWRSRRQEIKSSIDKLRNSNSIDNELLDVMEDLLEEVKVRTSFIDYYYEEV